MNTAYASIDDYISSFPPATQVLLEELRAIIRASAPDATERISYQMPTYFLHRNLVHFAAYAHHIGFYPTPSGVRAFDGELEGYKRSKGAIQFPIDRALPVDLIQRIVSFRVKEETERVRKK